MQTWSEPFQIFEEGTLAIRLELRAECVAAVAVARQRGVVERTGALRFCARGHEADRRRVEEIVAAPEPFRPLFRRIQEISQRGYRAVVQVGSADPEALERRGHETVRLPERREPPGFPAEGAVVGGDRCVG